MIVKQEFLSFVRSFRWQPGAKREVYGKQTTNKLNTLNPRTGGGDVNRSGGEGSATANHQNKTLKEKK